MSSNVDQAIRDLLDEGLTDWVPVDRIIDIARDVATASGSAGVAVASDLITAVIQGGLMVPGDIGSEEFERWEGGLDELVARVVQQCQEFDWLPQGAGCWFANTALGDRMAKL